MSKVDDLRAQLKAAEAEVEAERKALRASVKREWQFTFAPFKGTTFDILHDDACVWFNLVGKVQNREALIAVGYSEHDDYLKGGSMRYLVNTATGRIVMHCGGGSLFIVGETSWRATAETAKVLRATLAALEQCIRDGQTDVTSIIVGQPGFSW